MMELLRRIPADASWTRVSVQALHRFYRGRGPRTVASWMTRQDRELLIADNVAYVDEAMAAAARHSVRSSGWSFCGFSQGVAMAFRAGLLGARRADAVLALGGDVPPELLAERRPRGEARSRAVLLAPRLRVTSGIRTTKLGADERRLAGARRRRWRR